MKMFKALSIFSWVFFLCFSCLNGSLNAVWTSSTTTSSTGSSNSQIGIDYAGNAIAIWEIQDGCQTVVQAATLPIGGSWSNPIDVSIPGLSIPFNPQSPQIAIDPAGNAVAVWTRSDDWSTIVQAATLPFGSNVWIPTYDLSLSGGDARDPQVAVNAEGNAVAVWTRTNGDGFNVIQGATLTYGSTVWVPTEDLSNCAFNSFSSQIAVDTAGNAVAVWVAQLDSTIVIQGATLPFGSSAWIPATNNLSDASQNASQPQVVVDSAGNATAIWSRSNGSNIIVQSSTLLIGSKSWSSPTDVSPKGIDSFDPQIGVDSAGNTVAVWSSIVGSDVLTLAATQLFGGNWSTPIAISNRGELSFDPQVTVDASGNAIAVWDRDNGSDIAIQAAMFTFESHTWSTPVDISVTGQISDFPQIAMNANGYAVLDWTNETFSVIQSATWIPLSTTTDIAPNFGMTMGGNPIIITGTNFIDVIDVKFGGISASSFTVLSPTSIIAIAPAGTAGTVNITVATSAGTSSITANDRYTYQNPVPLPSIAKVNPSNGPKIGGNPVRIVGSNFTDVTAVQFGSTNVLSFTVVSPGLIIAIAPPGSGVVDVRVFSSAGISSITAQDQYAYQGQ